MHPRIGQGGGERVLSAPAGAVPRHEQVGLQLGERLHGRADDRLEERSAEVETAEECRAADRRRSAASRAGTVFTTPACPQPVRTTRPRSRTCTTSAWSSRTSGSCVPRRTVCRLVRGGMPLSNSVVRSISPVIRTQPSTSSDGCRRSTTSNPSASSAVRLSVGSSHAARHRARPAGGASTRAGARSSAGRIGRGRPPVRPTPGVVEVAVAQDDALHVAEVETQPGRRSRSSRRATGRCRTAAWCARSARRTVTSAENPCSARRPAPSRRSRTEARRPAPRRRTADGRCRRPRSCSPSK